MGGVFPACLGCYFLELKSERTVCVFKCVLTFLSHYLSNSNSVNLLLHVFGGLLSTFAPCFVLFSQLLTYAYVDECLLMCADLKKRAFSG